MSNQYTVITGPDEKAYILAPDEAPHRQYTPGDDAATLADCLRLATDEAARLNNVGVTYRLEGWVPEFKGDPGLVAYWQCQAVYTNEAEAVHSRDVCRATGALWRVVRQTREVLP